MLRYLDQTKKENNFYIFCLFVRPDDKSKSIIAIIMKLLEIQKTVPDLISIDFDDDPDIQPAIRFFSFLNICLTTEIRAALESS